MNERTPSADEWAAAEGTAKAKKTYASHVCPFCGRTIREGAWGGRSSNFDKHLAAHAAKESK